MGPIWVTEAAKVPLPQLMDMQEIDPHEVLMDKGTLVEFSEGVSDPSTILATFPRDPSTQIYNCKRYAAVLGILKLSVDDAEVRSFQSHVSGLAVFW